jgi:hypothetical protein
LAVEIGLFDSSNSSIFITSNEYGFVEVFYPLCGRCIENQYKKIKFGNLALIRSVIWQNSFGICDRHNKKGITKYFVI